jgi:hypothetical protein
MNATEATRAYKTDAEMVDRPADSWGVAFLLDPIARRIRHRI